MSKTKNNSSQPQDDLLYCQRCGISFLWAVEEQTDANANEQSLSVPTHCPGCRRLLPLTGRERGLVKWFNGRKRFGFITRHNSEDVFAPEAEVQERARLQPGDLVEFSVGQNERGSIAQQIHLLVKAEQPQVTLDKKA